MTYINEHDDCEPHPELGAWLVVATIIILLLLLLWVTA